MKLKLASTLVVVALLVGFLGMSGTIWADMAAGNPERGRSTAAVGSSPVSSVLLPGVPASRTLQQGPDVPRSDDEAAFPAVAPAGRIEAVPVLIIEDQLPWNTDAIEQILNSAGIAFGVMTSAGIPTVDLSLYDLVVIPSVQTTDYYTTLNANIAKFETYVTGGGKLWMSGCTQGDIPLIPGGVTDTWFGDNYNDILKPDHPWVWGVPNPMYGTYASHNVLTNLPPRTRVIAIGQSTGEATLIEYNLGTGHVAVTGQTLEFAWLNGQDGAPILKQSLLYMFDYPPDIHVPVLSLNDPYDPYYEPNDTFESAYGALQRGQGYAAYPDDEHDYYYFTLSSAKTVSIVVSDFAPTSSKGDLLLYNGAEVLIRWFGIPGYTEMRLDDVELGAGKYYIQVYTVSGNFSDSQLYTLRVTY
jgi:hypothetical protein